MVELLPVTRLAHTMSSVSWVTLRMRNRAPSVCHPDTPNNLITFRGIGEPLKFQLFQTWDKIWSKIKAGRQRKNWDEEPTGRELGDRQRP